MHICFGGVGWPDMDGWGQRDRVRIKGFQRCSEWGEGVHASDQWRTIHLHITDMYTEREQGIAMGMRV